MRGGGSPTRQKLMLQLVGGRAPGGAGGREPPPPKIIVTTGGWAGPGGCGGAGAPPPKINDTTVTVTVTTTGGLNLVFNDINDTGFLNK